MTTRLHCQSAKDALLAASDMEVALADSSLLDNLGLNSGQRAALAVVTLVPKLEEEAKDRQRKAGQVTGNLYGFGKPKNAMLVEIPQAWDKSRKKAARLFGVNEVYISRAKRLLEEAPDLFERVFNNTLKIAQATEYLKKRRVKKAEEVAREKAIAALPKELPTDLSDIVTLYAGDLAEVLPTFAEESIDAIITDPPYPREYLGVYLTLAEQGTRVLKPGGSMLVMVGQSYLPEILAMMTRHIPYRWTLSYLTPGHASTKIWNRNILSVWKPILWFVKGEYTDGGHGDLISNEANDRQKSLHIWQQNTAGMARLVEGFTKVGDVILDPFMGSGTTGLVAVGAHRRFIGIDIVPENLDITRGRLATELRKEQYA